MISRRRLIVPALGLAMLGLSGAPSSAQSQTAHSPYLIGVTIPLSGPLAQITAEYVPALQIAADQINAAGGVGGHPLRLLMEDTQGTPQGGIAAMRKLVQVDGAQLIITLYTNVTTAQIPLADELKVPLIAASEGPGLMSKGQYTFGNAVTFTDIAPLIGEFWKAKHVHRVYALLGNNAWGQSVSPVVERLAQVDGIDYTEAYLDLSSSDYRGVITRLKEASPDAIFITAQGTASETTAIRQIRELGITTQIYIPANFYQSQNYREALGPYSEGMIFGGLYVDPRSKSPFIRGYRAREHHDPVYPAAEYYDIVRICADALSRSPYNGPAIRDALLSVKDVPSVFGGTLSMRPDHYTNIGALGLFQVRRGILVPIWGALAKDVR